MVLSVVLGSAMVKTYINLTVGIQEGGRTRVTAITMSVCFLASLFFSSLLLLGAMMMHVAREIESHEMKEGIPTFVGFISTVYLD
jgi:AGZA family xanthine/uracil permease-like MFS transporter